MSSTARVHSGTPDSATRKRDILNHSVYRRSHIQMMEAGFDVYVSKADFKFNCAHFIAHSGFRERLHGHNYRLAVKVSGTDTLGEDGYLVDFGDIKKVARSLCSSINEYFVCPMRSDVIAISEEGTQLCLKCEDGSIFSFPKQDCAMLPLVHSSAEELAHYFWCQIVRRIGLQSLRERGGRHVEVSIAEAPQQIAIFRSPLPESEEGLQAIEKSKLRSKPKPCFSREDDDA